MGIPEGTEETDLGRRRANLLSLYKNIGPDALLAEYDTKVIELNLYRLASGADGGAQIVAIDGSRATLVFLAELILAQAWSEVDCGIEISPTGPGNAYFSPNSQFGLYIHISDSGVHPEPK